MYTKAWCTCKDVFAHLNLLFFFYVRRCKNSLLFSSRNFATMVTDATLLLSIQPVNKAVFIEWGVATSSTSRGRRRNSYEDFPLTFLCCMSDQTYVSFRLSKWLVSRKATCLSSQGGSLLSIFLFKLTFHQECWAPSDGTVIPRHLREK